MVYSIFSKKFNLKAKKKESRKSSPLRFYQILRTPNASSTEETSIATMKTGATYLITTEKSPRHLNLPESSISSITVFGFKK